MKKAKFVVKLMGRLGNQLSCYAFAKYLHKYAGVGECKNTVLLDASNYRENKLYGLYHFQKKIKVINVGTEVSIKKIFRGLIPIKKIRQKINCSSCNWTLDKDKIYEQKHNSFYYDTEPLNKTEDTCFVGFWHCYKYFDPVYDELCEDFRLRTPLNKYSKKLLKEIKNTNSIALHIRRGDLLWANGRSETVPLEYYYKAVSTLLEKTGIKDPVFYIFSDGMDWVKENLKLPYKMVYSENDDKHNYADFELMKNCKHNIIANSSFSWWAAYLNQNKQKVVIAPVPWYSVIDNYYDLFPKEWIVFDVDLV